jgi:RimJ/RimL family protein N-acetyltransferase
LRPCAGEPELSDPAVTGEFAEAMAQVACEPQLPPWCGYVGWHGATPQGFGGFKGPPADNTVEIGYLTFPAHVGRGVATTIARQLVEIAWANGADAVLAHTLPETNASTRVLEKAGLVRDGWGNDEDVGRVWRWRLDRTA